MLATPGKSVTPTRGARMPLLMRRPVLLACVAAVSSLIGLKSAGAAASIKSM
jgi:hypothetical protein